MSGGHSESSGQSSSQSSGGTNDNVIQNYMNQLFNYNRQNMGMQGLGNLVGVLQQQGFNTMGGASQALYNAAMQQQAMNYNSAEAQKNRDWQEYMSNTAYQRAMKDLKAAGVNPILAFGSGISGATTPSGGASSIGSGTSMGLINSSAASMSALGGSMGTSYSSQSSSQSFWNSVSDQWAHMLSNNWTTTKKLDKDVQSAKEAAGDKANLIEQYNLIQKQQAGNGKKVTGKAYKPGNNPYTGG